MINAVDSEDTTILILALKNKYIDICTYLLKDNADIVDILIKSKKFSNAIQLAMKNQEFEIIDAILNHN
jgi:ankyrin repeat protein